MTPSSAMVIGDPATHRPKPPSKPSGKISGDAETQADLLLRVVGPAGFEPATF
jgi:hypothetical protein